MNLSKKQQAAAIASGHVRVIAGPGSGKTTLLIARTAHLLKDPDASVAMVTFASNAAKEMQERLSAEVDLSRVLVSTFDAFARRQVMDLIAGRRPPKAYEQKIAVTRAIRESGLGIEVELAEEIIAKLSARMYPDDGDPDEYRLFSCYQDLLERDGFIEFSEVARMAVEGMRNATLEPLEVTHLCVDEFQDTSPVQLAWLEEHWRRGILVTVVGDDDQCIYGFRQALGFKGMERFAAETLADDYFLDDCYRCSPEIVDAAQNVIGNNTARIPKRITSQSGRPGRVTIKTFENAKSEEIQSLDVFLRVHEREGSGRPAVLARTNRALDTVEANLKALGWKVNRIGGKSIWDQRGAGLMLGLADLANSRERSRVGNACSALLWAGCKPSTVDQYRDHVYAKGLYAQPPATLSAEDTRIQDFYEQLCLWSRMIMSGTAGYALDLMFSWVKTHSTSEFNTKLAAVARRALKPNSENPKDTLGRRLAVILIGNSSSDKDSKKKSFIEAPAEREVPVDLATLHSAKGMEWDSVWLFNADELQMPSSQSVEAELAGDRGGIEEERRLFYVGMTRAKVRLGIGCSLQKISRFAKETGLVPSNGLEDAYDGAEFSLC